MNRYLLGLLLFVLVVAIAQAQDAMLAQFTCKDGWCVTTDREAQRIIEVFKWLQDRIIELQGKTGCT